MGFQRRQKSIGQNGNSKAPGKMENPTYEMSRQFFRQKLPLKEIAEGANWR